MADGGAMFGAIPKRAWKRKYQEEGDNLCRLSLRCALAVSGDRKILIDTGMGDKHLNKVSYYQPQQLVSIPDAVQSLGYCNEDITDVILTHLHFDHSGGSTIINKEGEVVPTFPNARYWLSRKQWNSYQNPSFLEADSIFPDNIQPIYDAGLLNLIENDFILTEGFKLSLFDGHSEGQIVTFIDTKNGICVFPGDLIPTSAHVPLEWISAYDISAIDSVNEKSRFLQGAEQNDYTLIYCHDAYTETSKVKKLNDSYKASK